MKHRFIASSRRGRFSALLFVVAVAVRAPAQPPSLQPTPVAGDARMVTFAFDDDRIYKVLLRPRNSTQLEFHAGEIVTYVSAGNKNDFVVTVPTSRAFIEVKPKWDDTSTNLLVVTTRHTYHVDLQSTGEGRKWYARVAWTYEDAAGLDATGDAPQPDGSSASRTTAVHHADKASDVVSRGIDLDRMNSAYTLSGDAEFRPTQVFDDGVRTFLRVPQRLQELPALFMVTPDTHELARVNYAVVGDYLVAQRTMDRFVLQLGKAQVRVERESKQGLGWLFGSHSTGGGWGDLGDRVAR
jgi:type IV secretion system protein VirB9